MRVRQMVGRDMTFGNSQANFLVDSPAAVAQVVDSNLILSQGEWYLNINDGTPYFTNILGYNGQEMANAAIINQIQNVTGIISSANVPSGLSPGQSAALVTSIDNYSSTVNPDVRSYSATGTLNTIYGPTALEIQNQVDF